jgi:hypothetical protein
MITRINGEPLDQVAGRIAIEFEHEYSLALQDSIASNTKERLVSDSQLSCLREVVSLQGSKGLHLIVGNRLSRIREHEKAAREEKSPHKSNDYPLFWRKLEVFSKKIDEESGDVARLRDALARLFVRRMIARLSFKQAQEQFRGIGGRR